jgi:hypothetical protein
MDELLQKSTVNEILAYDYKKFITCVYSSLLGRIPDQDGMNYYHEKLLEGNSKADIISWVCRSNEYQERKASFGFVADEKLSFSQLSDEKYIEKLYRTILLRSVDPSGFNHYLSYLKAGGGREKIILDIYNSDESKKIHSIKGLSLLLMLNRIVNMPIIGTLICIVICIFSIKKYLKAARALESKVHRNNVDGEV